MPNYYISGMIIRPTIVLTILISFLSSYIIAAPSVKITPEPSWLLQRTVNENKTVKLQDISNGYYISLYDEQINIGEQSKYYKIVKSIENETGVQYNSEISITFPASYQELFIHNLYILRDGKKINKLSQSKIQLINTEPDLRAFQINDYYKALIILDDVRKGDKIVLSYTKKGFNPIFKKYSDYVTLYSNSKILNYYSSILMPKGRKLFYKAHNDAPEPKVEEGANYTIYGWHDIDLEEYEYDYYTPGWYLGYKYVEISEYNDWKEVADWAYSILPLDKTTLPQQLNDQINKWYKDSYENKARFLIKALRFVQNDIRYLGIEIGEYTHRPHLPQQTYTNRYGDCKDKSLLLASILKQKGIPAYLVLVNSQYRKHIGSEIAKAISFDHVIVKATVDGKDYYVDPTLSNQAGSLQDNYTPDYGLGLVLDGTSSVLTEIPFNPNAHTKIIESYDITYDSTSELSVTSTYKGADANIYRGRLSQTSLSDMKSYYEDYYASLCDCKVEMDQDLQTTDDTVNNIITIKEHYKLRGIWQQNDGISYIQTYCQSIYDNLTNPEDADGNKPINLSYPNDIEHTIILNLPDSWEIDQEKGRVQSKYYDFSYNISRLGSQTVTLNYEIQTLSDHIPSKDVAKYQEDYKEITNNTYFNVSKNDKLISNINKVKKAGVGYQINWIAVFLSLITLIATILLLIRLNKKETQSIQDPLGGYGISGWLIILGIVLFIRPLVYGYSFYEGEYLNTTTWLIITSSGKTGLQLLLLIEMMRIVFFFTFSIWVFYWFLKRRDIFPKMFVTLVIAELSYIILFWVVAQVFKKDIEDVIPNIEKHANRSLIRHLVHAAIWVTAVLRSDKVKYTFVKKYKYQEMEPIIIEHDKENNSTDIEEPEEPLTP